MTKMTKITKVSKVKVSLRSESLMEKTNTSTFCLCAFCLLSYLLITLAGCAGSLKDLKLSGANMMKIAFEILFPDGIIDRSVIKGISGTGPCCWMIEKEGTTMMKVPVP